MYYSQDEDSWSAEPGTALSRDGPPRNRRQGPRAIREETHVLFVTRPPEASAAGNSQGVRSAKAGNAAAAVRAAWLANAVVAL